MYPDDEKKQTLYEHQILQSTQSIDTTTARHLISRIHRVAVHKDIDKLGGQSPDEWRRHRESQIGMIPLVALLAKTVYDMVEQEITLVEALCEEPEYLISCLNEGKLTDYLDKYPPISISIEDSGDLS